jgi:hypothetical protein
VTAVHDVGAPPAARAAGRRRAVFPAAVVLVVLIAAGVAALAASGTTNGDLDPASGAPNGSRALARILELQGVEVTRATDPSAVTRTSATVVVVHPELVAADDLRALRLGAPRVVLVEPDATVLDAFGLPEVRPAGVEPARTVDPGCSSRSAVGPARAGGTVYSAEQEPLASVCYPDAAHRPRTGSLVELGGDLAVLGQADVLRNAYLDQDANAALALRLLGTGGRLTWLVPDPLQGPDVGPASLGDALPPAVRWVALQLTVAVVLALLWRARRLGPLVREPLPVAVRSVETLQGRARLYRRARARGRAAATLRTAWLRRVAARLAVPPEAGPDAVAVRAAEVAGTDVGAVRRLLLGPPPGDDRALVALADALDDLEHALATSTREAHR